MVNCLYRYNSVRKVHFWKMLSVTVTYEPVTFKMSSASRGPGNEYMCWVSLKYVTAFRS